MRNIKQKRFFVTILLLPFVLAGCLFPEEFESEVEVNKDGTFSFSYDGILVFVPGVLEEYRRGKLSPPTFVKIVVAIITLREPLFCSQAAIRVCRG